MNCLVRGKFISCIILIVFELFAFIKCDECTVQAICACLAKNESTGFHIGVDGFLEGHLAAGDNFDICHPNPPPPNSTTTTTTTTTTPKPKPPTATLTTTTPSQLKNNNITSFSYALAFPQAPHLVLSCESVETNNKSSILPPTKNGTFTLSLKYPCKAPHPEDHGYSTGSILVIIFFTIVVAYLGLGIAVRFFMIGARGVEVLPNLDFWRDFPALVRDGAKFLQNGCKARPSDLAAGTSEGYDAI